jgi:hypothetical protein
VRTAGRSLRAFGWRQDRTQADASSSIVRGTSCRFGEPSLADHLDLEGGPLPTWLLLIIVLVIFVRVPVAVRFSLN